MFEKVYCKYLSMIIIPLLAIMLLVPTVMAKSPVIIRYDAHLMEKDVRINLAWQSDEPIVKIIASAGKEQVVIVDNIDNERNEGGYSGEIDIVVPAYLYNASGERTLYMSSQSSSVFQQRSTEMYANSSSPHNEAIQYTVQIVDEVNQRSILVKDKVRRIEPSRPHEAQKPIQKSTINTVTINTKDPLNTALNTTIGLAGKIGQTPIVKNVTVKSWTENRVSIGFEATGSKGIDKVAFEVRDARGNVTNQSTISCDSEKSCTKQSEPFPLTKGNYTISVVATDIEKNKSNTIEQEFQFSGNTDSAQQTSKTKPETETQKTESVSSSTSDSDGDTYEKE